MAIFPTIECQSLEGDNLTLPLGEKTILLLSFDQGHYPVLKTWFQDLNEKSDGRTLMTPVLSDRFLLMKDALLEGLKKDFKLLESNVYPLFVNRISFFDSLAIKEETKPLIAVIEERQTNLYSSPDFD